MNTRPDLIVKEPNWDCVWECSDQLSDSLDNLAKQLPRRERGFARLLANWFKSHRAKEAALVRPDVLEICWPLLRTGTERELTDSDILRAIQLGVYSADRIRTNGHRIRQILMYPLLLLTVCIGLAIAFSVFVMPEFERMFTEFGIDLPMLTTLVLRVTAYIRENWLYLILVPSLILVGISVVGNLRRNQRPVGLGWFEEKFRKTRSSYADWAWHVSLLLRVGEPQDRAMMFASRVTDDVSIRLDQTPAIGFKGKRRFRLLEWALQQDNPDLKVVMLEQVANYYRDQSQRIGEWWLQWLITIMFWVIGILAALVVFSLFSPLLAVITGVSGVVGF